MSLSLMPCLSKLGVTPRPARGESSAACPLVPLGAHLWMSALTSRGKSLPGTLSNYSSSVLVFSLGPASSPAIHPAKCYRNDSLELHSSTVLLRDSSGSITTDKYLIYKLLISSTGLKQCIAGFVCCDFPQDSVDKFFEKSSVMKLSFVYPPDYAQDGRPRHDCLRSASHWHSDCL